MGAQRLRSARRALERAVKQGFLSSIIWGAFFDQGGLPSSGTTPSAWGRGGCILASAVFSSLSSLQHTGDYQFKPHRHSVYNLSGTIAPDSPAEELGFFN